MFIFIEIIAFDFVKQNVLHIEYNINHFTCSFECNISPTIRKLTEFESNRIFNIKYSERETRTGNGNHLRTLRAIKYLVSRIFSLL